MSFILCPDCASILDYHPKTKDFLICKNTDCDRYCAYQIMKHGTNGD